VPVGAGFSGLIAQTRQPRYVADVRENEGVLGTLHPDESITSMLGVPMEAGDRLVGVLHVDWREHHPYSDSDVRFLEIVADRMALSIRNSQLYEGERRIAQVFQESLLSLPDHVNGVRYARAYHSATQEARVGGDFFDLFPVDGDRVAVLIGDVSGKGIEAAVFTSLVKDTIRAHAHEGGTPSSVLSRTNTLLEHYSGHETFVTVFFGILEHATGRFVYCNAGHPPALVSRCDGELTQLASNSPLLGAFPDMVFTDTDILLGNGETVFLYTDGVVEARRAEELYGEDRLLASLLRQTECDPQAMIDGVLDDLMDFTSGVLTDDLAILSLKVVERA
jgi:serine phosphatase RsbU (regulator of sigma subunit)